jgi:hypothetical protein
MRPVANDGDRFVPSTSNGTRPSANPSLSTRPNLFDSWLMQDLGFSYLSEGRLSQRTSLVRLIRIHQMLALRAEFTFKQADPVS